MSQKGMARLAGLLYALAGGTGVFSYLYLPATFITAGDAGATARNIAEGASIYRLGIVSEVVSSLLLLCLAFTLYELLKDFGRSYARLMLSLIIVAVGVAVLNIVHLVAPLVLASSAASMSAFSTPQLDALALLFLKLRGNGVMLAQVFWGLWLLPFGLLVIRSGLFPKLLGVLLIGSCVAYVADSLAYFLSPGLLHILRRLLQPIEGLGEGSMMLWLLIVGVRRPMAPPN